MDEPAPPPPAHSSPMRIRRLFLVDDHEMFTEALAVKLSAVADLWVAGRSTIDEPGLLDRLAQVRPDVIIIEPCGGPTSEILGWLTAAQPETHIVVLTASQDPEQVIDAARAGADGWLPKESLSDELLATIRAVCDGHACYPAAHLGAVLRALRADVRLAVERDDPLDVLSRQERRVLASMVEGARGPQIAVELRVSVGTVRAHAHSIFTKLGVHSRLEAVKFARAAGMRPRTQLPAVPSGSASPRPPR